MINYSELIIAGIAKAHKEQEEQDAKTTIITKHKDGTETITRFYKKNGAIWCRMVTGCITSDSRVYKINTERPYIRDLGRYWYLGTEEKKAISYLL